jgi:uncharacterized protein
MRTISPAVQVMPGSCRVPTTFLAAFAPASTSTDDGERAVNRRVRDDGAVRPDDSPTGDTSHGLDGHCPVIIDRPVMRQRWERLTFVHWRFEPAVVQRLLPGGLTVDVHDGAAWVGLVPFTMRVATAGGRAAPWASRFHETNVRTYVRDQEGNAGLWFFSLDAARLGAVVIARTAYRLPYYWSAMTIAGQADEITYTCRRRWPAPPRTVSHLRVRVGAPFAPEDLTERDHFLTARWVLFSAARPHGRPRRSARAGPDRLHRFARAWHEPWPLRRADVLTLDDGLVAATGLPHPDGEPLAHYSPGVDVRIGRPERFRSERRLPG